jgi:hypothetical protein
MSKKKNDERILIDLSEIPELHKQSDIILEAVYSKKSDIFQMYGNLIRVLINDGIRIEKINKYVMRRITSECVRLIKNSDCDIEKHPPISIINDVLAIGIYPFFELKGICRYPLINKDGDINYNTGFDKESGLYIYNNSNYSFDDLSNRKIISKEEIASAKNVIYDLLSDFKFKSLSDLTNYIGLIIVIICRSFFDGLLPLHLIKASTPGIGKTLLSEIPYLILTGERPAITSLPDNENEMRKTIFAFLLSGVENVIFDNVKSRIDSGVLAATLTSGKYRSRILTKSQSADYNVRFPIIITANNPDIDKELARRIIPIELITTMENPALRTNFKYQDIRRQIIDNRYDYLKAFLTIIKNWFLSGRKEWLEKKIGSFEGFCKLIGGILEASEFPDFLENYEGFYNSIDYEFDIWRAFVFKWYEKYGNKPILAQDITDIALETDFIDKNNKDGSLTRQLGKQLSKKAETITLTDLGNLRLMRGKTKQRAQLWYLENMDKGRG